MVHRRHAALTSSLLICAVAAGCTSARTPQIESATPSPLLVQSIAASKAVAATDGKRHLLFELLLVNQSPFNVTVNSMATVDVGSGAVLNTLSGDNLANAARLTLLGGDGASLQPSQSSIIFADVVLAGNAPLPAFISTRITSTQTASNNGAGNLGGLPVSPQAGAQATVTFETARMPVESERVVVLAPPVRGGGWVVFRGCCDVATSHRGGTGAYGGQIRIAERFAIDLVQTDEAGMLVTGPGNDVRSYVQYGAPVYAVADGEVVSSRNTQPDEVPGQLNNNLTEEQAGGNAVVLNIGNGRYVLYGHLQRGSVRVKAGDIVKAGYEIGRIGNSGKTFAPHLHLHVSTSAVPGGDGLPFVFSSFTLRGRLNDDPFVLAQQGRPAIVSPDQPHGPRLNAYPLNNDVLEFAR
jgi:murein DD-endopeptidase MepM/ murein hydrolase activator NlpD